MSIAGGNAIYRAKRAASLVNPVTTAVVFKQADNSAYATYVSLPWMQSGDTNERFRIRAVGRATAAGAYSFVAKIQFNSDMSNPGQWASALTITNNTDVGAGLTSATVSTATRPWWLDLDLIWDSTSGRLAGRQSGLNSEVVGPVDTTITALTGIDLTTGKCGFVVNAVFGTTNASNIAYLDDFVLEAI